MMALIWGGASYSWSSKQVVSTLAVGLVFLVVFALHQLFINKEGLFHRDLFKSRNFVICLMWVIHWARAQRSSAHPYCL